MCARGSQQKLRQRHDIHWNFVQPIRQYAPPPSSAPETKIEPVQSDIALSAASGGFRGGGGGYGPGAPLPEFWTRHWL